MFQTNGSEIPEAEMNLPGDRAVTWHRKEHSKMNSSQNPVLGAQGIVSTEGQLRSSAHPRAAERFLKARNSPSLVSNGVRFGIGHGRHLFRS